MRALGLMSGTSMDGVDAAVVETDGVEIAGFGPSAFRPYGDGGAGAAAGEPRALAGRRRARRRSRRWCAGRMRRRWPGSKASRSSAFTGRRWRTSRGGGARTRSGAGTGWRGTAGGRWSGTSAPPTWRAAARGRRWCRSSTSRWRGGSGRTAPVAFLNLGGVGNVTWVDPRAAAPEAPGALVAFDTGPGNALIDDFLAQRLGRAYDADGAVAAAGRVHEDGAGRARRAIPTSQGPPPKSLDRQDFHAFLDRVAPLSTEDGAATLAALTVACVAEAARHFPEPVERGGSSAAAGGGTGR